MYDPATIITRALRARYKTPQAVLRALGLDAALLKGTNNMPRYARDQVSEELDNRLAEQIVELLRNSSPEVREQLREMLAEMDDDPQDEPPPFPGRPRPGGKPDPIAADAALSRRSREHASFARRFPNAARVQLR